MVVPLEAVTENVAVPRSGTPVFVGWTVMIGSGPVALHTIGINNARNSQQITVCFIQRVNTMLFLTFNIAEKS